MYSKETIIQAWLDKAYQDERAFYLLRVPALNLGETAAFHAQQAVEKWLKALLVFHNINFRKTHDINVLINLLTPVYDELTSIEFNISSLLLSEYAVDIRYPVDFGFITNNALDIDRVEVSLKLFKSFTQQKLPNFAL